MPGRFRTFVDLDVKIQYPFNIKFHDRHFQFRAGSSVLNVLNYSNPRAVQQYTNSPNIGNFYNSTADSFASTVISISKTDGPVQ